MLTLLVSIGTVGVPGTATNVVGAATATVLTAKTEGLLNKDIYNGVFVDNNSDANKKSVA